MLFVFNPLVLTQAPEDVNDHDLNAEEQDTRQGPEHEVNVVGQVIVLLVIRGLIVDQIVDHDAKQVASKRHSVDHDHSLIENATKLRSALN